MEGDRRPIGALEAWTCMESLCVSRQLNVTVTVYPNFESIGRGNTMYCGAPTQTHWVLQRRFSSPTPYVSKVRALSNDNPQKPIHPSCKGGKILDNPCIAVSSSKIWDIIFL